jgi:hypothetical protein
MGSSQLYQLTNSRQPKKVDRRRKDVVSENHRKIVAKRAADPDFDKKFKKQKAEAKARYMARKKDEAKKLSTNSLSIPS